MDASFQYVLGEAKQYAVHSHLPSSVNNRDRPTSSDAGEPPSMRGSLQQTNRTERIRTLVVSTPTPTPSDFTAQSSHSSLWPSPFQSSQPLASGPTTPRWSSVSLPEQVSPPSSPSPFVFSSWNPLGTSERSASPISVTEQRSVSSLSASS